MSVKRAANPLNTTEMQPHDTAMPTLAQQLEALIDRHGMANVIHNMAFVADEKAQHLRVNWQDNVSARSWESVSRKLYHVEHCAQTKIGF